MISPDSRPDPLAEPPRPERRHPGQPDGPDLTVCSAMTGQPQAHCDTPPVVIFWIGCLKGEHVGPMTYCAAHATPVVSSPLSCAQCGGQVRIMKITSMDGVSTSWDPPPPGHWRGIFTPP